MKMTIEIDCTPDEARAFFGLPDLRPLHEEVLAEMKRRMAEATRAFDPDQALKAWMGASGEGFENLMKLWTGMAGQAGKDRT